MSTHTPAQNAFSSLLGTVATLAQKTSDVVNTAASSIDLIDNYVENVLADQQDRHKVHRHHFRRRLLIEAAQEQAQFEEELDRKLSADASLKGRFNAHLADLTALFDNTPKP